VALPFFGLVNTWSTRRQIAIEEMSPNVRYG